MTSDKRPPDTESIDVQAEPADNAVTSGALAGPTIGEYLRNAREQAGLSVQDVSKELCMPLLRVKALESDDFVCLNSNTFIRGYLRAYAKLLKIDPAILLDIYHQQVAAGAEQPGEFEVIRSGDNGRSVWKVVLGLALALLILWLVSVWFLGNRAEPEVTSVPSIQPPPADYVLPGYAASETPTTNADDIPAPATDSPVADAPPVVEPEAELIEQAPALVLDTLQFQFNDECWLEVSDSLGDVLFTNLVQSGRELRLEGKAPFEVKLGNAQAARISLNGEPVALNVGPSARLVNITVGE